WHMPEMLALRKFAISKRAADGSLIGTGAYKVAEWQQGERVLLNANDDYWGGRSYPDAIEFQMGSSLREQLVQRQLGVYSAAELTLDQLRALELPGQNPALSRPTDLVVIVFPSDAPPGKPRRVIDPRIREALAAAIDRATLSNALLQRRGSPASGLLPQWLTGYEFMLGTPTDRERARKLVTDAGLLPTAQPISLAYDFSDPITKLI